MYVTVLSLCNNIHKIFLMDKISTERVNQFLNGHDPMERIITIECGYDEDEVSIVYVDSKGIKRIRKDAFKPFIWVKNSAATRLFNGDRKQIKSKMRQYGISVKQLITTMTGEAVSDRLESGYKYLFYAKDKMSYSKFQRFFTEGGVPIHERPKKGELVQQQSNREFMGVTPVEQYMIESGKRLFKGYESYNELHRLTFDLETQGLNPQYHRIEQFGIHTNRGFDKILSVEGKTKDELDRNEKRVIEEGLIIMSELKPDIIAGHNSENFDWDFIMVRYEILGGNFESFTSQLFPKAIYKKEKESVLKLGGEIEYYKPTIIWGFNVLDSLHAARRAQAIDSNMKSSNLKYVTKYLNLKKPNRVYVPGDKITTTWAIKDKEFAFSDTDGDWYRVTDSKPLKDGYELVSGRYIVERYLLDDLWETDKVEDKLNESNFLVGKMLPTTFTRACTMGTAGIWKLIMLAWCYENDLAVPSNAPSRRFTGGLSRLLKTGYVDRVVKLDYNSLYPSIILTWNVSTDIDIMDVMLSFLNYILTQREKYKGLKGEAGAKADEISKRLEEDTSLTDEERKKLEEEKRYWKAEKSGNDKKQLPLKILANSFFGSYGCPQIFPYGDSYAAEMTTCLGRMSLRLMISHFKNIGYEPIVGDSFTSDTPLLIKYDNNLIDIKPISWLIDEENVKTDLFGREYDYSRKNYKVLCRSGWVRPSYIYRHKTTKDIYEVEDSDNVRVDVTEDHSLFNDKKEKIKPSTISDDTKLEYYNGSLLGERVIKCSEKVMKYIASLVNKDQIEKTPLIFLNLSKEDSEKFINMIDLNVKHKSKALQACLMYIHGKVNGRLK